MRSKGIRISPGQAEEARRRLASLGLLDRALRIFTDGTTVVLPVTDYPAGPFQGEQCIADFAGKKMKEGYREQARLPDELKKHLPSSFDVIGTKALLKLPKELEGHEIELGEAILKANPSLDSVFVDSGVSGELRTRSVRAVAGTGETETVVVEYGLRFRLDVAKTFYSPRLASERRKVSSAILPGEKILDMFAGVGPFSLHAARKARTGHVVSLDINPYAVSYLKENAAMNNLGNVEAHMRDAFGFTGEKFDRIIMNLPSSSSEFLEHAAGLLLEDGAIDYYELLEDSAVAGRKEFFHRLGLDSQSRRKVKSYSPVQGIYHFSLRKIIS